MTKIGFIGERKKLSEYQKTAIQILLNNLNVELHFGSQKKWA